MFSITERRASYKQMIYHFGFRKLSIGPLIQKINKFIWITGRKDIHENNSFSSKDMKKRSVTDSLSVYQDQYYLYGMLSQVCYRTHTTWKTKYPCRNKYENQKHMQCVEIWPPNTSRTNFDSKKSRYVSITSKLRQQPRNSFGVHKCMGREEERENNQDFYLIIFFGCITRGTWKRLERRRRTKGQTNLPMLIYSLVLPSYPKETLVIKVPFSFGK